MNKLHSSNYFLMIILKGGIVKRKFTFQYNKLTKIKLLYDEIYIKLSVFYNMWVIEWFYHKI